MKNIIVAVSRQVQRDATECTLLILHAIPVLQYCTFLKHSHGIRATDAEQDKGIPGRLGVQRYRVLLNEARRVLEKCCMETFVTQSESELN